MHFVDKMFDHLLRNIKISDDPVFERTNDRNIAGCFAHHQLGIAANRAHFRHTIICLERYHGWLIEHDPAIPHVDKRIGRTEVDRQVE